MEEDMKSNMGRGRQALALAHAMNQKLASKSESPEVCHACGGTVNKMSRGGMAPGGYREEEDFEYLPGGGHEGFSMDELAGDDDEDDVEPGHYAEGGGVDMEYEPHSINDTDGDDDDLVYSPEVESSDFSDKAEDDTDEKRSSFLRAYLIHNKARGK